MSDKYPKQPVNPERKPSESVTWVRNQEKLKERIVVTVEKPVHPVQRPLIVRRNK